MKKISDKPTTPDASGVDTNIWPPLLRGIFIIILGVGGFLLWAVQAPLDAGVVEDGTVTVSSNRKTIQHLSGGRVTDIFIKEGDLVKKNQVLVRLDKMQLDMCYSALSAQYISAKAIEDLLLAERDGLEIISFSKTLSLNFANNKRLEEIKHLQEKLFETRRKNHSG